MEPVDISFRVNDKDIEKASQRAVDSILGIGHAGEESVRTIKKKIKEQKELIALVGKDVKEITEKFNKLAPGKQKDAFVGEVRAVKRALEEEKAILKGLETQLEAAHDASRRLAFTKRSLTDQMMKLKLAGQEDSEAFRKLANEAAEVERAIRSVNKQMQSVGRADANFQGFVSGLSGVAGAFSAGAGAMALFGKESQDLQQVQTRLQALMAITIGLQQAYNSLNKASAFQVNILAKAKRAWGTAQAFLNVQLGIGVGLSRALMASGIGLLIAGIGMLVAAYQNWAREQEEINALQAELKAAEVETVKAMSKQTTEVRALIAVANDYNASLVSRREAVRQLNELMPGYNAHINQEGKLIGGTDEALKKYLDTLYKVEKAKVILSNMSKAKEQLDELNVVGPEKLGFWEKFAAGVVGAHSERKKNEMIADFKRVKEIEHEGNKRALESALKEMEGDFSKLLQDNTVFDALFGDENYKNKQKRLSEQAKKEAEKLKKAEAEINEELRRLAEKNITDRIGLLEEGTQKELAKIRDKYNRTIAEADRLEKEWAEKQKKPLTEEQKKEISSKKQIARDVRVQEEGRVIKALVDKYKDFAAQRLAIETKFNKDIAELEKQRIDALLSGNYAAASALDQAITQATKNKAKELTAFDFDLLKKNPDYVRAFEDLRNTSSETLSYLLEQFETFKEQAAESLDPTQLREYTSTIQQLLDELTVRNPFKALSTAQEGLRRSKAALAVASASLSAARDSGDTEKAAKAEIDYRRALDDVQEATNNVVKSQKAVNVVMAKFFDTVGKLGDVIGGQAGEIVRIVGEIGNFVVSSIEGIQAASAAGATALATIEKASAILGIIQLVMQLLSALDSLTGGAHKEYERLAEKQKQINLLSTAVNDYQLAVLKARNAEAGWFAEDKIRDLWHLRKQGAQAYKSYVDKLNEDQAKYIDKYTEGERARWGKAVQEYYRKNPNGLKPPKLDESKVDQTVKAIENLRIETRAGKKGFLGIGRKSQKTEDLREWVKRELKTELFKDDGMLNKEAYDQILEKYGDKLVGETKETLEYLKKMQEEHEAYQQQLQEYVSSLYSPLLDNMTQAIWDWFDNGKNAMDQFREYSRDTFRNIANEMVKALINKHVFDGVGKQLEKLHDDFFSGKISEKQLYEGIAKTAENLDKTFEEKMPIIQKSMEALNGTLEKAGIDLYKPKQQAEKGFHTSVSQESFNEWLGQFVALRIHASNANVILTQAEASMRVMATHLFAIETNTRDTVQELKEVNTRLKRIETEGVRVK